MTTPTHEDHPSPARTSAQGEAKFWDNIAESYAAQPIKDVRAYERTMDRTRAYLSKEDRVLEVGCGTGTTAVLLAPCVAHITASDISERMLAIGRARAREAGADNVDFRCLALPNSQLETGAFGVVLAFNALHLVDQLADVLGNLHRALSPGGLLISKTVCMAEQTRLWAIPLFILRMIGKAPRVKLLGFSCLEDAIRGAGFEILETGTYPEPRSRFVVARKL